MENMIEIVGQQGLSMYSLSILSILINILIAVIGILPSVFLTMFNVEVFGLYGGLIISIIGESLGAVIAFYLYRKGLFNVSQQQIEKHPKLKRILSVDKKEAFKLIVLFRLFPYIPSGLLTYIVAISKVDIKTFFLSSTIGKIPSLLIEVMFSYVLINASYNNSVQIVIAILSVILIIKILKKTSRGNNE